MGDFAIIYLGRASLIDANMPWATHSERSGILIGHWQGDRSRLDMATLRSAKNGG